MSKIETNTIDTVSGTTNLTIGSTNTSTITMPNGKLTGHMYPAFEGYVTSSSTSVTNNTTFKVNIDAESFDTDNCYDHSTNYRFTPNVAGKYYVYAQLRAFGSSTTTLAQAKSYIYKNGSLYTRAEAQFHNNYSYIHSVMAVGIIDMNGTSDYLEMYGVIDSTNSSPLMLSGTDKDTKFGAYRIGA